MGSKTIHKNGFGYEGNNNIAIVKEELLQIRQALDSASMGHLSVPPQKLSQILLEVSQRLSNELFVNTHRH